MSSSYVQRTINDACNTSSATNTVRNKHNPVQAETTDHTIINGWQTAFTGKREFSPHFTRHNNMELHILCIRNVNYIQFQLTALATNKYSHTVRFYSLHSPTYFGLTKPSSWRLYDKGNQHTDYYKSIIYLNYD